MMRLSILVLIFLPVFLVAQPGRKKIIEGNELFINEKFDAALNKYQDAQLEDPNSSIIQFNIGDALYKKNDHEKSLQAFQSALKSDDPIFQSQVYYNIGNSLFVRGHYKKAIQCWLRTAELEPGHPQINYRIAQAYWADGDITCCREHFLAELRVNPGDIDVIFDFGLFLLENGDVESAKEKFNRILELEPNFAAALFYLGEIAYSNRDFKKAVSLFSQALQKNNTLAGPCYRLAQHALMKEQQLKTRAYLVSELETCPEDADTLVSMGSMFLSIC